MHSREDVEIGSVDDVEIGFGLAVGSVNCLQAGDYILCCKLWECDNSVEPISACVMLGPKQDRARP